MNAGYTQVAQPTNLVLASAGGVLESYTSQYGANWPASALNDGSKDGFVFWACNGSDTPQTFIFSFKEGKSAQLTQAVFYNRPNTWGSKGFEIWGTIDGTVYTKMTNGTLTIATDPQTFGLGNTTCKKVKLIVTTGYEYQKELIEFEVIGYLGQ